VTGNLLVVLAVSPRRDPAVGEETGYPVVSANREYRIDIEVASAGEAASLASHPADSRDYALVGKVDHRRT
jgi:hypothetical protein